MPATMSSIEENSSGVWLRPSLLRTKTMATLAIAAICCESCPAPLAILIELTACAFAERSSAATSPASLGTAS